MLVGNIRYIRLDCCKYFRIDRVCQNITTKGSAMIKKNAVIIFALIIVAGCATPQKTVQPAASYDSENVEFLNAVPEDGDELFRVVIMSDTYTVVQKTALETISRTEDKSADKFIYDELNKYDKINEVREAILTVSLFPDTGRIMKIRPKRLASLREIDELIVEDLQRWNFVSPNKKTISPLKFDVRYRVVLRKKQTDDEILKEVREKMKEKG
jgi:hypothetical protein